MAARALLIAALWLCSVDAALDVLIGVKSAVVAGAESRRLIRETWASAESLPPNTRVVFLSCEPDWTDMTKQEIAQSQAAIRHEKEKFRDLLTHELNCSDSYYSLVEKVTGFFSWLYHVNPEPMPQFVMLADDDVYVHVPRLLQVLSGSPSRRFYAGQVVQTQLRVRLEHIRDPRHKNFVSPKHSPMTEKPLYATGAHYILSADIVEFLGRNYRFLRGLGSLEDTSVGMWTHSLLRLQPFHLREFINVKQSMCNNRVIALGDLSQLAVRQIHSNVLQRRCICDGFSFRQWNQDQSISAAMAAHSDHDEDCIKLKPDLKWDATRNTMRVAVSATAGEDREVWLSGVYTPSHEPFHMFCASLIGEGAANVPRTGNCDSLCDRLRRQLSYFVDSLSKSLPGAAPLLALARSNVKLGVSSPAIIVRLTAAASEFQPLVESLMSNVYPDAIVFVCDEEEHRARIPFYTPDIVVLAVTDLHTNVSLDDRYPAEARHIIINEGHNCGLSIPEDSIVISSCTTEANPKHLHIPRASFSFIYRRLHSPRDLLSSSITRSLELARHRDVLVHRCTLTSQELAWIVDSFKKRGLMADTFCETGASGSFPLDNTVDLYRSYRYVAVFESLHAGTGEEHIVSAFLAGSVPVWIATNPTQLKLFSTKSYIQCSAVDPFVECIDRIKTFDASESAYQALRASLPVTNVSAFVDAFSWHPDVGATLMSRGSTASAKLQWLINNT